MANNKFNNKTRSKVAKNNAQHSPMKSRELIKANEPDLSMLRKPIETSITGFAQARTIYDTGTEELRALLSTECDLVYECRVCRNLFRSLANFISHKRVYCKQKFNKGLHAHFNNNNAKDDTLKILELEQEYQDFLKNKDKHKDLNVPIEDKLPFTRDLTMILEKLTRSSAKGDATASDETLVPIRQTVAFQDIPTTSVAAFQNVVKESEKLQQTMRAEVTEIDKLMESENVVLQPDGTCVPNTTDVPMESSSSDSSPEKSPGIPIIQISDDDDDEEKLNSLICKLCDLQFSTQKTLKFHMKYKHIENRLVYPCPDCTDTFSTSWSVFRHLFKVHRKTAAQIRRLRETIQAKAFRMNNPPAHYEKRRNNVKVAEQTQTVTEEERMDQENQAWMDNMETDGEIPRCGGCGRRFERRAALAAHTNTCQPRRAAQARMQLNSQRRTEGKPPLKDTPPKEQPPSQGHSKMSLLADKSQSKPEKKIEIQIRRDYNKAPSPSVADVVASRMKNSNLTSNQSSENVKEKDCDDATERKGSNDTASRVSQSDSKHNNDLNQVCEKTQNIHTVKAMAETDTISRKHIENTKTFPMSNIEKQNIRALKLRVGPLVDYPKLMCKKCSQILPNSDKLLRHMASHLNWNRFACKLCEHKTFNKEKCMLHVRNIHKLKGNAEFYASTVRVLSSTEAECLDKSTALGQEDGDHGTTTSHEADSEYDSNKPALHRRLSTQEQSAMEPTDDIKSTRKRMRKRRSEDVLPSNISSKKTEDTQSSPPKAKKMPIPLQTVMRVIFGDLNETSKTTENDCQKKTLEENNDDEEEKICNEDKKKESNQIVCESFASSDSIARRPIRNRAKPKNKDFEYDMSNLLKLEAVAYKESHTTNLSQKVPLKRKSLLQTEGSEVKAEETSSTSDCTKGALKALSSKAVLCGRAQMRESNTPRRYSAPFLRPPAIASKFILSNLQPKQVLGSSLPMQRSPPMSMMKKTSPCTSPPMKTYEKLYSVKKTCLMLPSNTSKMDSASGTKVADPSIVVDPVNCVNLNLACNDSSDSDNNKPLLINESEKSMTLSNNIETVKPTGDASEHTESSSLLKNIKNTLKGKILVIKPMINRSDITKTVTTMIGTSKYQTIKLCGDSKVIAKRELPIKTTLVNAGDKASVNCPSKSVSLAQVPQAVVVSQHHAELDSNKEDNNSIKEHPIIKASKSKCSDEQNDFVPILPIKDELE